MPTHETLKICRAIHYIMLTWDLKTDNPGPQTGAVWYQSDCCLFIFVLSYYSS
jgi:hypothetical protein